MDNYLVLKTLTELNIRKSYFFLLVDWIWRFAERNAIPPYGKLRNSSQLAPVNEVVRNAKRPLFLLNWSCFKPTFNKLSIIHYPLSIGKHSTVNYHRKILVVTPAVLRG